MALSEERSYDMVTNERTQNSVHRGLLLNVERKIHRYDDIIYQLTTFLLIHSSQKEESTRESAKAQQRSWLPETKVVKLLKTGIKRFLQLLDRPARTCSYLCIGMDIGCSEKNKIKSNEVEMMALRSSRGNNSPWFSQRARSKSHDEQSIDSTYRSGRYIACWLIVVRSQIRHGHCHGLCLIIQW